MKPPIVVVILAAGSGKRMGLVKQLMDWKGKSLILRACDEALDTCLGPVVVVTGANEAELRKELSDRYVSVVSNTRHDEGMGTSIIRAIEHIESTHPEASAVIFMLCDQPYVISATLLRLAQKFWETGATAVASAYEGAFGVPALFSASHLSSLKQIPPEEGAKGLLKSLESRLELVEAAEAAIDIDTPEDYERLVRRTTLQ